MATRCASDVMKRRIAVSSCQRLQVQNVWFASRSVSAARLPAADFACALERNAYQRNPGTKRHERRRSRVIETNGMTGRASNLEALQRSLVEQLLDLHEPRRQALRVVVLQE